MVASLTSLPVIGVPIPSKNLNGLDSLLSIVQMPYGVPVATVAIGGAKNAALLAIRILGIKYKDLAEKIKKFSEDMRNDVLNTGLEA
jgi:5-(carboxyamino)imidazole ribonucleotide mutase